MVVWDTNICLPLEYFQNNLCSHENFAYGLWSLIIFETIFLRSLHQKSAKLFFNSRLRDISDLWSMLDPSVTKMLQHEPLLNHVLLLQYQGKDSKALTTLSAEVHHMLVRQYKILCRISSHSQPFRPPIHNPFGHVRGKYWLTWIL